MLKLRRGVVSRTDPLMVRVAAEDRPAWADCALVGEVREGDEVIVNVEARDLGLGSGGFDVVHVNLTRGLDAPGASSAAAMKLNYSSLQHPVEPVEALPEGGAGRPIPVLVISLHGQLAPAAWAAASAAGGMRVGYVQTAGGALPGSLSTDVAELRRRGLLRDHISAAPAYGGEREAISVIGALRAACGTLGWDAAIVGPGPGIAGSASALGHGGMAALDSAHASIALGLETMLAPRMSSADPRARHRGLSHHTETVLRMLLGSVRVPVPVGEDRALAELTDACGDRHELWARPAALEEYGSSGLPTAHMGRSLREDPLFFAAALAAGNGLGAAAPVEEAA
ncbi:MAG TPA: DUF3866 family protein [Solirubrobacterales bacterium]|nr:DUF3866 family protein [Solirubrobacterales bacterium]